jgi:hypothetical protein
MLFITMIIFGYYYALIMYFFVQSILKTFTFYITVNKYKMTEAIGKIIQYKKVLKYYT